MAIFELSSKKYKNGRRPFTAILYELQPPDSVVNDIGTKFNKNGITFLEEYASKQLDSIKDMSVTVSFIDEDRTMISDHGDTGVEDGLPIFDNATTVGHFTKGYIDSVEINGETKRCVLGKGFIDEMRYKSFVETLESEINSGHSVDGSIEIYRSEGNENIVYKKGWIPEGRIPTEYIHSGWAMVLNPADVNSTLLELNSKKQNKEEIVMNEKEMRDLIVATIVETNDKNNELSAKINELNSTIADKDTQIADLNAKVEANATADAEKDAKIEELNGKVAELEAKLDECKKAEQNSALDKALEAFTETEQKYAESEINAFRENPIVGDLDVVINAINAGIGKAVKAAEADAKIAEQNAKKEDADLDIFSEVNSAEDESNEDVNIF